ncbi:PREDICTED: complement component 1 Q subcomponent-binding protein, mitochondrial [Dufourea novaeangliae]|uniref:Complement component 1 Q subcomponent-binding protein, mitochondrial n=1 Tax=Dufourea novaeangliae TaxID=178035 RepID=A0A154PHD6_DUFNO|nr:PREDICTED: complement component 1 Q subcomponent-binding protein, mitochondrial [Dufourea novaeangliae]KZC11217.1 Complement component 1 Q subcomponent-binding protein, mitochondrial [Dufourea novaeangliae]
MNSIIRNTLRSSAIRNLLSSVSNTGIVNNQLRTLWRVSSRQTEVTAFASTKTLKHQHVLCNCSCCRRAHTKAEKELVEFLAEEIVAEKKAEKLKTIPTALDGFKVSLNGAQVNLQKEQDNEIIKISFNINHTVDSESEPELDMTSDSPDIGEMKSKPTFTIDIVKGNQTLGFSCSFNNEPGASGANDNYNDIFGIDEITLYEGDQTENVYAVAGEIIDGYLYDLLMNYLEEKGISNEFAEKLIDLSTNYEHTAYVSLLEGLSKFTSGK